VLDPTDLSRIIGVLDWEMTTIGDPLMDLGTTLGYWAEPEDAEDLKVVQCFLTTLPGSLSRMEVAREYERLSGRELGDLTFYYVFALLKLAVIVQQIYYRYVQGLTRDPRFASMIGMVRSLGRKAAKVIETNRIGR
jgi:aminoglycoside phosphotransferase (APT) family kinase protein